MKKFKSLLSLCLLMAFSAVYAVAPMALVPTQGAIYLRSDGSASVMYTLTSQSTAKISGITIDPAFRGGNADQISFQNDTCSGSNLVPSASCTFELVISGQQQASTFTLSPRACGNKGTACATSIAEYRVETTVAQIPVAQPVNAYVAITSGSNLNKVLPITVGTNTLGTPISGFDFVPPPLNESTEMNLSPLLKSCFGQSSAKRCIKTTRDRGVGITSVGSVLSLDGQTLYVTNAGGGPGLEDKASPPLNGFLSVVDVSSNPGKILNNITVGTYPINVVMTPNGKTIYVGNSNTVSVINNEVVTATISIPFSQKESTLGGLVLSLNPSGTLLFVSSPGLTNIYVYNTSDNTLNGTIQSSLFAEVSAPSTYALTPTSMIVSPDGSKLYVGNTNGYLYVFSAIAPYAYLGQQSLITISEGEMQGSTVSTIPGLAISSNGQTLYAAVNDGSGCNGYVSVVNVNMLPPTITGTISLNSPYGLSLDPSGTLLYATDDFNSSVYEIDLMSNCVTEIPVGGNSNSVGGFVG